MQIQLNVFEKSTVKICSPTVIPAASMPAAGLTWTSANAALVSVAGDANAQTATLTIGALPSGVATSGALISASYPSVASDTILLTITKAGPGS